MPGRGNTRKREDTIRGKFPNVKLGSGPVVYVAEFDNGIVKVGFTCNARSRLSMLQTEVRRLFGETSVARVHVTPAFESSAAARRAEDRAVSKITAVAQCAKERCIEYFRGITFDEAVRVVSEA